MKPRTKLEKLVTELSGKLPAITKEQEDWAKKHLFDHFAYSGRMSYGVPNVVRCGSIRVKINWVTKSNALIATINWT